MMAKEDLFKNIQKKSGVDMNEVFKLANSIQGANFKDENTVREIINKVAKLANKKISKEKENQLVKTITQNTGSINMQNLMKMMDKTK